MPSVDRIGEENSTLLSRTRLTNRISFEVRGTRHLCYCQKYVVLCEKYRMLIANSPSEAQVVAIS